MDNIMKLIGKFWFPVVCIFVGLTLLLMAMGPNAQPPEVIYGSLAIMLVGIISLLFLIDVIKKPIRVVFTILFSLGAVFFLYLNANSISSRMDLMQQVKFNKAKTIQALKDVRSAQEAYRQVNGQYTQNLDELIRFVKTGSVPKIKKIGAIPDSVGTEAKAIELGLVQKMPSGMTDEQIQAAGLIVRDTVQVSVMEDKFTNEIAMKARKFDFDVDKMKYAPSSGKAWEIKAGVVNLGGVDQPVLEVIDPMPFENTQEDAPNVDPLKIGSMEDAHLNGNWKED